MLPGLAAGWSLVFVWSVAEISAAAILSGTGNVVVGFRILEIFNNGQWSELAALSLVVAAINLIVVGIVAFAVRRKRGAVVVPHRAVV
jgi:iron(III) transport system permease protein